MAQHLIALLQAAILTQYTNKYVLVSWDVKIMLLSWVIRLKLREEFNLFKYFMLFKEAKDTTHFLALRRLCPYLHLLCLLQVILVNLSIDLDDWILVNVLILSPYFHQFMAVRARRFNLSC